MSEIALQAKNRWRSILPALGVSADHLSGKHGPCPVCSGKDRFRFDDKDGRGTFYCTNCGAGDGFKLLQLVRGWEFPEAAREVERVAGLAPVEAPRKGPKPEDVQARMKHIWKAAAPLDRVPAAVLWWERRIGRVPRCPDLRSVDELYHAESKRRFPGMVALVRDAAGEVVNMHRTFLTAAGAKAPVTPTRMVMPLDLPPGCAIRLARVTGTRIGVAEGIETAAAATLISGVPTWATMTADNMSKWTPPEGMAVTVFADNDKSYTGAAAAFALAKRLVARGIETDVQIPSARGEDWNDVLIAMRDMGQFPSPANENSREAA